MKAYPRQSLSIIEPKSPSLSTASKPKDSDEVRAIKKNYLDARKSYQAERDKKEGTDWHKYHYHSGRADAFAQALGALGAELPGDEEREPGEQDKS